MSPELLDPEPFGLKDSHPTKESDCYAMGMVIYEVLSGQTPFFQYKNLVVILKVMGGERPERPQGAQAVRFTDGLWGMLDLCWKPQPRDRPSIKTLLWYLEGVTQSPQSPSPTPATDRATVTGTDHPLGFTVANPGPSSTSSGTSISKQLETGGLDLEEQPLTYSDRTVILRTPRTMCSPPASSESSLSWSISPQIFE